MEFLKLIDNNFASLITLVGTLGGAFIGSLLTSRRQKKIFEQQTDMNLRVSKKESYTKTLQIYSAFLEVNGRISVVGTVYTPKLFQFDIYIKEIRPLFYSDLSLLHEEIIDWIIEIDSELAFQNYYNERSDLGSEEDRIINIYSKIYLKIEHYVKKGFKEIE